MSVLLKGGAGLSVSVKPFVGLSVSVRPVAVFRCEFEFERAPEFFILMPLAGAHWHIIAFPGVVCQARVAALSALLRLNLPRAY